MSDDLAAAMARFRKRIEFFREYPDRLAQDQRILCDACEQQAQEIARLLERVQWFEASGGVTTHTRVFAEMSRAERAEAVTARYKAALEEIAAHPHIAYDHPANGTGQYGIGCADGHRCAAQIAAAALAEEP